MTSIQQDRQKVVLSAFLFYLFFCYEDSQNSFTTDADNVHRLLEDKRPFFLTVFHAVASAKNALWAHPCLSVCLSECRDFPLGQATCIIAAIVAQQLEPIVAYPTVTVIVFLLQFLLSLLLNYCLPIVVIPAAIVVPIAIVIPWPYFRQLDTSLPLPFQVISSKSQEDGVDPR
jgi:hypothetical protein